MIFEWDPRKAAINLRKHGVSFETLDMKAEYDFSHGKRGAIAPAPESRTKCRIFLDKDLIQWMEQYGDAAGGRLSIDDIVNTALRQYKDRCECAGSATEPVEVTLRRVLAEMLGKAA